MAEAIGAIFHNNTDVQVLWKMLRDSDFGNASLFDISSGASSTRH